MTQQKNESFCRYNKFKRPSYFHGMLLDDKDFADEQAYHINMRRFLNRMLHGWGVVCGLDIKWKTGERRLELGPGLALDCCGREIWVCESTEVDLTTLRFPVKSVERAQYAVQNAGQEDQDQLRSYYIGLSYKEIPSDLAPVYSPGGGCDQPSSEPSRRREGYCVTILDHCCEPVPGGGLIKKLCDCEGGRVYQKGDEQKSKELSPAQLCQSEVLDEFCERSLPCPVCPECGWDEHYVILGRIEVNWERYIQNLWINDCRRYVLSGRLIQYLISESLSGLGTLYQVTKKEGTEELLDPGEMARNPIQGLCWLLRKIVVENGKLQPTEEGKKCERVMDNLFVEDWFDRAEKTISAIRREVHAYKQEAEKLREAVASHEAKFVSKTSHAKLDKQVAALDQELKGLQKKYGK